MPSHQPLNTSGRNGSALSVAEAYPACGSYLVNKPRPSSWGAYGGRVRLGESLDANRGLRLGEARGVRRCPHPAAEVVQDLTRVRALALASPQAPHKDHSEHFAV